MEEPSPTRRAAAVPARDCWLGSGYKRVFDKASTFYFNDTDAAAAVYMDTSLAAVKHGAYFHRRPRLRVRAGEAQV